MTARYRGFVTIAVLAILLTAAAGLLRPQEVTEIAPSPDRQTQPADERPANTDTQATGCGPGWTPNSCSIENEGYVRKFEMGGLFAVPILFSLVLPLLLPKIYGAGMFWWPSSPVARWAALSAVGFVMSALILVVLPWLGFPLMFKAGFIPGCRPCAASVSNYAPLGVPWGLPEMGMAILSPIPLLLFLLLSTAIWSILYLAFFALWKNQSGFASQCRKG